MPPVYRYPVWNGKAIIGYFWASRQFGDKVLFPYLSEFKHLYHRQHFKVMTVPIILRTISDNGVTIVIERSLDVRRKSKRQIDILFSLFIRRCH